MPHVFFTGGGTAGHVTPNIALIEGARVRGWQVDYVGSRSGIEGDMIRPLGLPFHHVASGKLRRYFSWQNFVDPLLIVLGVFQSLWLCLRRRPDVVFSKGGFVSVPLVVAAWLLRIPVVSHESDVTPGLANRLAYPFCRRICVTFEASLAYLPAAKVLLTGTPVRQALIDGDAARGLKFLGLARDKPLLLVFGGSLGATVLNLQIRAVLDRLLADFNVVHVTGAGNLDSDCEHPGYVQKEFIGAEFGDVLHAADLVVSRAGANTLYELFYLQKPHLLIPLTRAASRGDQLVNAEVFAAQGLSRVLQEEQLADDDFVEAVFRLSADRADIKAALAGFAIMDSQQLILDEIEALSEK